MISPDEIAAMGTEPKNQEPKEQTFTSMIVTGVMQEGQFIVHTPKGPAMLAEILANVRVGGGEITPLGTTDSQGIGQPTVITSVFVLAPSQSKAAIALQHYFSVPVPTRKSEENSETD